MDTLVERDLELAEVHHFLRSGGGAVLLIEGRAGVGKTSLLDVACRQALQRGWDVLLARGSELEADFAFGVVRQVFEQRLAGLGADERDAVLSGPARATRPLLVGQVIEQPATDTSFAVLHGLYWLAVNLAARRPLLIVVDDAHWADEPSLRWLAYLARRLEGLTLALVIASRSGTPASTPTPLQALREVATILRPSLLSESAVGAIVRASTGCMTSDEVCAALYRASGGNALYLTELLRGVHLDAQPLGEVDLGDLLAGGLEGIARRVVARVQGLDPHALGLAEALAVLGDGCVLRHAAQVAGIEMPEAARLAEGLVRLEVLASDAPPRFLHPVLRDAIERAMGSHQRDAAHRAAAHVLHADGLASGQVAAHLVAVRPASDAWVLTRLEEAAQAALESGAPQTATRLLSRALAEPPPPAERVRVLRAAAHAEASAGRETASRRLEDALRLVAEPRERAEVALEIAEVYAALFRWADAVEVVERALAELGEADDALTARLKAELVVTGLHDARCAGRVGPLLASLAALQPEPPVEAVVVAQGMARLLAGRPVDEIAAPLEQALARAGPRVDNWDTRAALLWVLVTSERYAAVDRALEALLAEVGHTGSARGFVAAYSTLGVLHLRLGALPEADAAAHVALRVLQEGDFAPGLAFAATVLADVAIEAGEYDEAQGFLDLLPQAGWPAGVGTVLIPAARGRLRLAQGRAVEALADFETCMALFDADVWGIPTHETGYVHARSGAALALLRLGQRQRARELAEAELSDVRLFGAPRAVGVALRVAGLARGGEDGLALLHESAAALESSPALLERARSLAELGAMLRRCGQRTAARDPLADAFELAVRCGARPLAARVREELSAAGARPRRAWRTGVEALSPRELHVVRLAVAGASNRQIAQELYVTLKTVEGHLARAYAKLGIERRSELAPLLSEEKTRVATL